MDKLDIIITKLDAINAKLDKHTNLEDEKNVHSRAFIEINRMGTRVTTIEVENKTKAKTFGALSGGTVSLIISIISGLVIYGATVGF